MCFLLYSEKLKAERETNRSQALWAAGYALMEATRQGDPVVNVEKALKALEDNSGVRKFKKKRIFGHMSTYITVFFFNWGCMRESETKVDTGKSFFMKTIST